MQFLSYQFCISLFWWSFRQILSIFFGLLRRVLNIKCLISNWFIVEKNIYSIISRHPVAIGRAGKTHFALFAICFIGSCNYFSFSLYAFDIDGYQTHFDCHRRHRIELHNAVNRDVCRLETGHYITRFAIAIILCQIDFFNANFFIFLIWLSLSYHAKAKKQTKYDCKKKGLQNAPPQPTGCYLVILRSLEAI